MNTKNLNMFLMDGTAMGPIKSTISTWSGIIYKVPRNILSSELIQTRQHFKHSGIYFLIGYKDNIPSVYVGQAGNRKTGEAILSRIIEHTKNPSMNFFTEVLILTTENNNFGPTELNYLEHTFNTKINQIGSYQSININNPNMGNVTEEKESELIDVVNNTELILGTMGYKLFVYDHMLRVNSKQYKKQKAKTKIANDTPILLYINRPSDNTTQLAMCKKEGDWYTVLPGSSISPISYTTEQQFTKKLREQLRDEGKIVNNILQAPHAFKSSSGAASFILGASVNGNNEWRTFDGIPLKDIIT